MGGEDKMQKKSDNISLVHTEPVQPSNGPFTKYIVEVLTNINPEVAVAKPRDT